jgi:hypothetical protein
MDEIFADDGLFPDQVSVDVTKTFFYVVNDAAAK